MDKKNYKFQSKCKLRRIKFIVIPIGLFLVLLFCTFSSEPSDLMLWTDESLSSDETSEEELTTKSFREPSESEESSFVCKNTMKSYL
jgi:hypothetical protein